MKVEFEKIKEDLQKFLKKLWQNLWLVLVLFLVLDIILGGVLFWKYYLKLQEEEVEMISSLKINQVLMEKVSAKWQERETIFEAAEKKEYSDPFRGTVSE